MNEDQFMKLFSSIEDIKTDILDIKENMATKDEMYRRFDDIAARLDDDATERAALESQTARHEKWIRKIADKTKTKLSPQA